VVFFFQINFGIGPTVVFCNCSLSVVFWNCSIVWYFFLLDFGIGPTEWLVLFFSLVH